MPPAVVHSRRARRLSRTGAPAHAPRPSSFWLQIIVFIFSPHVRLRSVLLHLVEAGVAKSNELMLRLVDRYRAAPLSISQTGIALVLANAIKMNKRITSAFIEPSLRVEPPKPSTELAAGGLPAHRRNHELVATDKSYIENTLRTQLRH